MKEKYYAVAIGRNPGIYRTWEDCQEQTDGFSRARFKSFKTEKEAREFIKDNIPIVNTAKVNKKKPVSVKKEKTIYIDGDNHIKEGQKGIENLKKNTQVRAVFSQPGAMRKFENKYGYCPNVSTKLVNPGDQAVDNQIKSEAGQLLKKGNQDIVFVSHDKDFAEYRDRKKNDGGGNRISVAESVKKG